MSKPATSNQQPTTESALRIPADNPLFLREEVVGVLGECKGLPDHAFVKRGHIMKAYGLSAWKFRQLVGAGRLTPKHFVFK
jgi:hypothetical protein